MAKNRVRARAHQLNVTPSDGGVLSGDPGLFGQRPGVALRDKGTDTKTTMAFEGMFSLSVKGIDGGGNSAVAEGDIIYYVTGDTPKLSKKATGVRYGYAGPGGAVTSGSTATVPVIIGY